MQGLLGTDNRDPGTLWGPTPPTCSWVPFHSIHRRHSSHLWRFGATGSGDVAGLKIGRSMVGLTIWLTGPGFGILTRGEVTSRVGRREERSSDVVTGRRFGTFVRSVGSSRDDPLGRPVESGSDAAGSVGVTSDRIERELGPDVWQGQECDLRLAAGRSASARDLRPQAPGSVGDSRRVFSDPDQHTRCSVLRVVAANGSDCRQAGDRAFDGDRQQPALRQRVRGADRLQVPGFEPEKDHSTGLAVVRVAGQAVEAE